MKGARNERWLAGIDGCRGGWVVALRLEGTSEFRIRIVDTIADVWTSDPVPCVAGIDIPIGLLEHATPGGRTCDREARKLLGEPRGRSVFSPPVRPALKATSYTDAVRSNRESSPHRIGLSRQSYGILPKIREVDDFVTRRRQQTLVEVHPELVFRALDGEKSVTESKKTESGLKRRLRLLERAYGRRMTRFVESHRSSRVARDDIVDAMAVCWTAERILEKRAVRLPGKPERDARGLRMEIVF